MTTPLLWAVFSVAFVFGLVASFLWAVSQVTP